MTQADMNRLAQIVAWGLSRGDDAGKIEKALGNYMSSIEEDDIRAAFVAGRRAVMIAGNLGGPQEAMAIAGLNAWSDAGVQEVRVLWRVRIGEGPDDWRSGATVLGTGSSPEAIMERVQSDSTALVERISREGTDPKDPANVATPINELAEGFGEVQLIYVAPL